MIKSVKARGKREITENMKNIILQANIKSYK
jgi:hypothetical protein